jgi:hypothetical protein
MSSNKVVATFQLQDKEAKIVVNPNDTVIAIETSYYTEYYILILLILREINRT